MSTGSESADVKDEWLKMVPMTEKEVRARLMNEVDTRFCWCGGLCHNEMWTLSDMRDEEMKPKPHEVNDLLMKMRGWKKLGRDALIREVSYKMVHGGTWIDKMWVTKDEIHILWKGRIEKYMEVWGWKKVEDVWVKEDVRTVMWKGTMLKSVVICPSDNRVTETWMM